MGSDTLAKCKPWLTVDIADADLVLDPRVGAAEDRGPGLTPLHLTVLVQCAQGLRALLGLLLGWLGRLLTLSHLFGEHSCTACNALLRTVTTSLRRCLDSSSVGSDTSLPSATSLVNTVVRPVMHCYSLSDSSSVGSGASSPSATSSVNTVVRPVVHCYVLSQHLLPGYERCAQTPLLAWAPLALP